MNKTENLHIRIDPKVKAALIKAAVVEQRSFSNLVQVILRRWVEQKK